MIMPPACAAYTGKVDAETLCPDVRFIEQMGSLLDDDEHCDVTFFVGLSRTEVRC